MFGFVSNRKCLILWNDVATIWCEIVCHITRAALLIHRGRNVRYGSRLCRMTTLLLKLEFYSEFSIGRESIHSSYDTIIWNKRSFAMALECIPCVLGGTHLFVQMKFFCIVDVYTYTYFVYVIESQAVLFIKVHDMGQGAAYHIPSTKKVRNR